MLSVAYAQHVLSEWLCHCRIPDTHVAAGSDLDSVQQGDGNPRKPGTQPQVCDENRDLSWVWWDLPVKHW